MDRVDKLVGCFFSQVALFVVIFFPFFSFKHLTLEDPSQVGHKDATILVPAVRPLSLVFSPPHKQ